MSSPSITPSLPKFLKKFSDLNPTERQLYLKYAFIDLSMRQNARLKSPDVSFNDSNNPVVKAKNRYIDIIPFDHNRVKLLGGPPAAAGVGGNWDGRDYVNASTMVAPYGLGKNYVISQGPLPNTIADFWKVMVQERVRVLVCLTKMVERNMPKCAQYWPDANMTKCFSTEDGTKVTVENLREWTEKEAGCIMRQMRVSIEGVEDTWEVTQLCFFNWPDHGVPKSPDEIFCLVRLAYTTRAEYGAKSEMSPILVHCSAGCGRTGTFCVIDTGLELLDGIQKGKIADDEKDLLIEMVDEFRKQRIGVVQTMPQLLLCYEALLLAAKQPVP